MCAKALDYWKYMPSRHLNANSVNMRNWYDFCSTVVLICYLKNNVAKTEG